MDAIDVRLNQILSQPQGIETIKQLIQSEYKNSLYKLTHKLGYHQVAKEVHGEIISCLEDNSTKKIICVPRGSFKSTICTVCYPIWRLLRDPNETILIDTELYSNSVTYLREIKQQLESKPMTELFGDFRGPIWNEDQIVIKQRNRIRKEASITAGAIGTTKVGQHYDCVSPSTLVYTSKGLKTIESINVNERVLGNDGKFHYVLNKKISATKKRLISIDSYGSIKPLVCTEDHRIYVFRNEQAQWIEAKDVKTTDYVALPIIKGESRQLVKKNKRIDQMKLDPDMWRLFGYWLAEGCHTDANLNAIRFSFGKHEQHFVDDVRSTLTKYAIPNSQNKTKSSTIIINCSDADLKWILKRFGTHAYNKLLPTFALNAPLHLQLEMLKGYFRGDGYVSDKIVSAVSVSKDLVFGFKLLLVRFGIRATVKKFRNASFTLILGNMCQTRDTYSINIVDQRMWWLLGHEKQQDLTFQPNKSFFTKNFQWSEIRSIDEAPFEPYMIDIEVENCHSFVANGLVVHNCVLADDYNSPSNTNSTDRAMKVIDHFKYNLNILNPGGVYVVVGTRYSEMDLIGYLLRDILEETELSEGIY